MTLHGVPELITAPTCMPVSIDEMRDHCRWTTKEEEDLLQAYLQAATEVVESDLARSLVYQTRALYFDEFPCEIYLRYPPVSEGALEEEQIKIEYIDVDTLEYVELDRDLYQRDLVSRRPRLKPVAGESWPETPEDTFNAVKVTYRAGYGKPEDVPEKAKQAIRLLAATWFRRREEVSKDQSYRLPTGYRFLIARAKLVKI